MKGILVGLFCCWFLAWLPLTWWLWLCGSLLVIGAWYYLFKGAQKRPFSLLLMFVCVPIFGVISAHQKQQELAYHWQKTPIMAQGYYQLLPDQGFPRYIELSHVTLQAANLTTGEVIGSRGRHRLNGRLKLGVYDRKILYQLETTPRGCMQGLVVLNKPRNYHNFGGFDYETWSQRNGLLARGYVKKLVQQQADCGKPWWQPLDALRDALDKKLATMDVSKISVALWRALILGDSHGLTSQDWQVLHRTGTTHLLVISGLHVGLVAALAMLMSRLLLYGFNGPGKNNACLAVGFIGGLAFSIFSGWGIPAQRAMIMLAILVAGQIWAIGWPMWQRLCLAFALTIIWQPNSLYSAGFWFSYIAIANLLLLWRQLQINQTDQFRGKLWKNCKLALISQIGLLVFLLPSIAFVTGGLSLVGPWLNLLLIPLFALFMVPVLMLASLLMVLLPANHLLFLWFCYGLDSLWQGLYWLASLPYALINVAHWSGIVWLLWLAFGGSWLLLGRKCKSVLLVLGLSIVQPAVQNINQVTLFDVGQGLAVWVRSGHKHMLYDLGDRFNGGFNLMEAVVIPILNDANVQQLDRVYVSHWDRDHSGGMLPLNSPLNGIEVKQWLLPIEASPKYLSNIVAGLSNVSRCQQTDWQEFGDMRIRHLSTFNLSGFSAKANNSSCVVQIDVAGERILLTGDIEKEAELLLVHAYGESLQSDYMLAPHHGSRTSSSAVFLQAVKPRVVLISAGYRNRFNHPHQDIIDTYRQADITWFSTAVHGQIQLRDESDLSMKMILAYPVQAYNK